MAITLNGGANSTKPASSGSEVLNRLNDGSTIVKSNNSVLDKLNDESEVKTTGNFSGGNTDSSSLRDKIKDTNKNTTNQTVDSTFNLSSGGSKFNDDTVFIGANNQTATLGEIKSGTSALKVDDVWSTTPSATSAYNTDNTKQGDYQASKAESSKVETGTFGKQNDIVTDPTLITQNKGLVGNDSIESVNGLVTTQKDKEGQEVLDSKKKRDEVEADDKTQSMRDRIKAMNQNTEVDGEAADEFNIGKDVEDKNSYEYSKEKDEATKVYEDAYNKYDEAYNEVYNAKTAFNTAAKKFEMLREYAYPNADDDTFEFEDASFIDGSGNEVAASKIVFNDDPNFNEQQNAKIRQIVDEYNTALEKSITAESNLKVADEELSKAREEMNSKSEAYWNAVSRENPEGKQAVDTAEAGFDKASNDLHNLFIEKGLAHVKNGTTYIDSKDINISFTGDQATDGQYIYTGDDPDVKAAVDEYNKALSTRSSAYKDFSTKAQELRQKYGEEAEAAAQQLEQLQAVYESAKTAAEQLNLDDPESVAVFVKSNAEYSNELKKALNASKAYKQTNYNREFTADIADANNFEVTYTAPDGSTVTSTYAEFAMKMAERSPDIAASMYKSKANQLREDGHPVLAKIEDMKAKMVKTWLGSKVLANDNKVRDQFTEMADLDMKSTYAAYNDVLSDETGKYTDEQKAEASAAIEQARALKTAAAALKASTGFWSGIGDSMSDGQYGTTNPDNLNTYQKVLFTTENVVKAALALGVTPAANKSYQNFYYMNKEYLKDKDTFLNKDWDKDGFAWVEEYGNNTTAQLVGAGAQLSVGIVQAAMGDVEGGVSQILWSIKTMKDTLYSVRDDAKKVAKLTDEITGWFKDVEGLEGLPEEVTDAITDVDLTQTEDFELKADEVGNLDNWLEGSGSNTTSNEKFNQSLSYDEWLKLIESDETMRDYAKKLAAEKKEKKDKEE